MNKKNKLNIRLLPIFIFVAVLTLSLRVNNIFDKFKNPRLKQFSISQNEAIAEEKLNKETEELTEALKRGGPTDNNSLQAKNDAFSQSEVLILQELAERRENLEVRAKEIDKKAIHLKIAEEEIDKKLIQLQAYETKLEKLVNRYNAKEKQRLSSLVKLYSAMKPKDAARIFNSLDMDILISLFQEMKPSTSSSILSQMNSEKAKNVTKELMGNHY